MSSPDDKECVNWEDVACAGDDIFNVWFGNPELQWAKVAWQKLREAGLTTYGSEIERHVVLCRLLVFGGIYHDFCRMAWDEWPDRPYGYMAEELELDHFILGRLYERLPDKCKDDEIKPFDALEPVVEAERSAVVSALLDGFGSETALYMSLLNSQKTHDEEDEADAASSGEPDSLRGYMWVSEGCYSTR